MTKEEEKIRARKTALLAFALVLTAGLILVLAMVLLYGGGEEEIPVLREEATAAEETLQEKEEDLQAESQPEPEEADTEPSKPKEVPGENDQMNVPNIICRRQRPTGFIWELTFSLRRSMRRKRERKPSGSFDFCADIRLPIRWYITAKDFRWTTADRKI